jgi:hypothetical protein
MRRSSAIAPLARAIAHLFNVSNRFGRLLIAAAFLAVMPGLAMACACGCGIFDVGTPSLIPNGAGGTVSLEYDFTNQYINWHATKPSSAANTAITPIPTSIATLRSEPEARTF